MRRIYTLGHREQSAGSLSGFPQILARAMGVGQHCRLTSPESALTKSLFLRTLYGLAKHCTEFGPNLLFLQKIDAARLGWTHLSGHQPRKWQEMGYQNGKNDEKLADNRSPHARNVNTPVNH